MDVFIGAVKLFGSVVDSKVCGGNSTVSIAAWTWSQCCDAATIDELSAAGITKIKNPRALGRWNSRTRNRFSWGAGKCCYQKLSVQEGKAFASFQQSVKRSLAYRYVNINMCRNFSRRK